MSKLQVSDNSLTDIANTTLANQLESRLKELERNIAVARQFIGMADECYSKVKHEWELLQQDIGVKSTTSQPGTFHPRKKEQTSQKPGNLGVFKEDSVDRPASQRISSTLNHFLLPVGEAGDLLEVFPRKNGRGTKRHVYTRKCTQS